MKDISLIKSNKGTTMIIFALALTGLMGFAAAVADLGNVCVEKQKLQNATDATALAAAQDLPDTTKALATANQYIQSNGFTISDIQVSFSDSNKTVNVTGTKLINFTFAKVLGMNSTTTQVSASASSGSIGDSFNYVLFSGSQTATLTLNGSSLNIQGSSHSNKNFVANGSALTISGACEAVGTVTVNGSQININNRVPNAPFVAMPNFSNTLILQANQSGTTYSGTKAFNGSNYTVDSPIYVNGSVTVNGSHFNGQGCILATGDITFNGSSLNQSTSDAICFYSQNGNITINGSSTVIDGIVYAPNGCITLNGSSQTVNGRVIGKTVTINGSSLNIIGGANDLSSLPTSGVSLTK